MTAAILGTFALWELESDAKLTLLPFHWCVNKPLAFPHLNVSCAGSLIGLRGKKQ